MGNQEVRVVLLADDIPFQGLFPIGKIGVLLVGTKCDNIADGQLSRQPPLGAGGRAAGLFTVQGHPSYRP